MKTTKSIISLLFMLLTAQAALAWYDPSSQRWLSRDPIGEPGFQALAAATEMPQTGPSIATSSERWINRDSYTIRPDNVNLYKFVANDPIDLTDPDGLRLRKVRSFHCLLCWNNLRKAYKKADGECKAKRDCYGHSVTDTSPSGSDADFDPDQAIKAHEAYENCFIQALKKAASADCLKCVTGWPIVDPTL